MFRCGQIQIQNLPRLLSVLRSVPSATIYYTYNLLPNALTFTGNVSLRLYLFTCKTNCTDPLGTDLFYEHHCIIQILAHFTLCSNIYCN